MLSKEAQGKRWEINPQPELTRHRHGNTENKGKCTRGERLGPTSKTQRLGFHSLESSPETQLLQEASRRRVLAFTDL